MERGDIYSVSLNPTEGREQQGHRPVLVVSPRDFNKKGLAWVCPITSGGASGREAGFTVSLAATGTKTTGVILCHQVRTLDLAARRARRIEKVPPDVIDEVVGKIVGILEG